MTKVPDLYVSLHSDSPGALCEYEVQYKGYKSALIPPERWVYGENVMTLIEKIPFPEVQMGMAEIRYFAISDGTYLYACGEATSW